MDYSHQDLLTMTACALKKKIEIIVLNLVCACPLNMLVKSYPILTGNIHFFVSLIKTHKQIL